MAWAHRTLKTFKTLKSIKIVKQHARKPILRGTNVPIFCCSLNKKFKQSKEG